MGRGLWAWLGMGGSVGIKKTDMWAVRRPQRRTWRRWRDRHISWRAHGGAVDVAVGPLVVSSREVRDMYFHLLSLVDLAFKVSPGWLQLMGGRQLRSLATEMLASAVNHLLRI